MCRDFHSILGALCVVGHQTACAELSIPFVPRKILAFFRSVRWLLWRESTLRKLPGLERKDSVLIDGQSSFFSREHRSAIELK